VFISLLCLGVLTDDALAVALEAAALEGVGLAFHLEPYEGRSVESIRNDLMYLHKRFGQHAGFCSFFVFIFVFIFVYDFRLFWLSSFFFSKCVGSLRLPLSPFFRLRSASFFYPSVSSKGLYRVGGKPWFYVYDSYHISPTEWQRLLDPRGDLTVRQTELDGVFVGLWLERQHGAELAVITFCLKWIIRFVLCTCVYVYVCCVCVLCVCVLRLSCCNGS